ncbi:MAG: peptide chain release factor N(5)-glutamine methyltransferase [Anaerolineales bacterium]|nr:peptide chain release factor N(5)-glutamine methyltransferase [Anaerolineales bacterium]
MQEKSVSKTATLQDALLDATRALGATMADHDARLQAELLLAHALETTRANVLARLNDPLAPDLAARYAANVARRVRHEPLAYILGHQEFFGLDFIVDRRVLIPRHETETLVQIALERARQKPSPVIVDVGTGSGALALTLAYHLSDARVIAADISRDALAVARQNARRLNLESRVEFVESDLLERVSASFDILVANLPYIPRARFDQLPREVREFEPRRALDGGADGLDLFRRLLTQLESRAARGGIALLEISEEQGVSAVEGARQQLPKAIVILHQDLEGLDRVVEIKV